MTNGLFIGFGAFTVVFVLVLIGYAGWLFASRSRRAQERASQRRWQDAARELEEEDLPTGRSVRQSRNWNPAVLPSRPIVVEDDQPDLVGGVVNAMVAAEIIDGFDLANQDQPDFTPDIPADPSSSFDPSPSFDTGSTSGCDGGGFGGDGGSF